MIPSVYSVTDRITLRVCNTDRFKAGMLSVSVVQPIRREDVWLTSLLLSVLRRGTEKYPSLEQLNRRLDYLYGTELSIRNFYRGDLQIIGFCAEFLDDAYLPQGTEGLLDGILDVMRQVLFHPLLDNGGNLLSHYVESEKQQQCDQIRARQNHARSYAADRCRELLYENEPCGAPVCGTVEDVMGVTAEQLTRHWRQLVSGMRLDCFSVGSMEATAIQSSLLRAFGGELVGMPSAIPSLTGASEGRESPLHKEESLPVGQGNLVLGLHSGVSVSDAEFYAAAVYNEMLGVSPVSKLFVNVRERESLCYHCSSVYNIYKGTLLISCGLDHSNRDRAEAAILSQIASLARGEFDEGELTAAKKSLENSYRLISDSPTALESYYFGRALWGVDESLEDCRARFGAVTRDEVIAFAERVRVDVIFYLHGTLAGEEGVDDVD